MTDKDELAVATAIAQAAARHRIRKLGVAMPGDSWFERNVSPTEEEFVLARAAIEALEL